MYCTNALNAIKHLAGERQALVAGDVLEQGLANLGSRKIEIKRDHDGRDA